MRANGEPMFLVANAVDDADMGITHVLRGEDLLNVTPKVLLLRDALGYADDARVRPPAADRQRAAQEALEAPRRRRRSRTTSTGATCPRRWSTTWPRSGGVRPTASRSGRWPRSSSCSTSTHVNSSAPSSTSRSSTTSTASTSARSPVDEFIERVAAMAARRRRTVAGRALRRRDVRRMAPLVQERVKRLAEVPGYVDFPSSPSRSIDEKSWEKTMVKGPDTAVVMLDAMIDRFATCEWTLAGLEDALVGFGDARRHQAEPGPGPHPGGRHRPHRRPAPLVRVLELLGRDERAPARRRRRRGSTPGPATHSRAQRCCDGRLRIGAVVLALLVVSTWRHLRAGVVGVAPGRRRAGERHRGAGRRAVQRRAVAGAQGPARPRGRAVGGGRADDRGDRRQAGGRPGRRGFASYDYLREPGASPSRR